MKEVIKRILVKLGLFGIARKVSPSGFRYSAKHKIKEDALLSFQKKYALSVFVETGTYLGEMVEIMKPHFEKIYSIELNPSLYRTAVKKFKEDSHITILQGDSGEVLPVILKELHEPCLFWLDAHYSAGITAKAEVFTPVNNELKAILAHEVKDHVILIDDAKDFNGEDGYPLFEALQEEIQHNHPLCMLDVSENIIRIYPAR